MGRSGLETRGDDLVISLDMAVLANGELGSELFWVADFKLVTTELRPGRDLEGLEGPGPLALSWI